MTYLMPRASRLRVATHRRLAGGAWLTTLTCPYRVEVSFRGRTRG